MDSDPCKWAVWFRKRGGAEIYLLKASSPETKELWIKTIKECHDKKRPGLLKGLLESLVCGKLSNTQNNDFETTFMGFDTAVVKLASGEPITSNQISKQNVVAATKRGKTGNRC